MGFMARVGTRKSVCVLRRPEVTSRDFESRRWHQLGRRNSALASSDGPGVSDFKSNGQRQPAVSRPDTAGGSTAKVVLASCCLGPGFSASMWFQPWHSILQLHCEMSNTSGRLWRTMVIGMLVPSCRSLLAIFKWFAKRLERRHGHGPFRCLK